MVKTYAEQCQDIVRKYQESGGRLPATAREIAAWALEEKLWLPERSAMISQCAEDLARAMREEYRTDPQGRRVRTKHAARLTEDGKQTTLWDDVDHASRQFMAISFQQRRQGIVRDCFHLKQYVDSYNENTKPQHPIQMPLDFTYDVAEFEAADGRYPNAAGLPSELSPVAALVGASRP